MTLSAALKTIHKQWRALPHEIKESHEAVWIVIPPTDDACEGDEEWVGIKSDGSLAWAYVLEGVGGEGHHETAHGKEIKVCWFDHKDMQKEWKEAIIQFAEKLSKGKRSPVLGISFAPYAARGKACSGSS
jgi:hypothetical protein